MQKPYNIGLDIGTESVGWAVVDEKFNIIRKGNKHQPLWGVRLFDEAKTAETRRIFRSTRRRYDRRRERIKLLQEEFKEEINKVDSNFFDKLKTSKISSADTINSKVNLTEYDKKEIFSNSIRKIITDANGKIICLDNKYPTIYHLRNKLIINTKKEDIRLVYLAIHHIIKYRGNFNLNMDKFDLNKLNIQEKIEEVFNTIFELCQDIYGVSEPQIEAYLINEIENSLIIESKSDKKKKLEKVFENIFHKKVSKELANALSGYQFNLENLFAIKISKNNKIDFKSSNFDNKISEIEEELEDKIEILNGLKELYESATLKLIFKDQDNCSISNLMVNKYKKHKSDLKKIKDLIKPNREYYKKIFKNNLDSNKKETLCLYTNYIKNKLSYNEFTNEIKKILENIISPENEKEISKIIEEIDREKFMPRITDSLNGMYPYQINLAELKIILENQGKYYPFLLNKVDDEYKIERLLKFRIPYYVGPLVSEESSQFAWMERKTNEKITPYNFNSVVDIRQSAKNFIYRMIGNCSYLLNEKSIPASSILYSKFKVLNELKQIKINDHRIDIEFQHKIYNDFFLKNKGSLTDKKFKNYLRTTNEINMYIENNGVELNITGYSSDKKFANDMNSYLDFFGEDGLFTDTDFNTYDAEKIIELITVLEDKNILREEILELYPKLENKISKILSLKYNGWSRLSKKLLDTKYYQDQETFSKKSIMDLMWDSNENFMQILNNPKYNFQKMIEIENNRNKKTELDYSLVSDLATSPANKRGIYQALKVIKEITDYMGYEPLNISIEMSRSHDKKQRTDDRKKRLLDLYDKAKKDIENYKKLKDELKNQEKINTEKLLLYFLQEGKSLYSKKDIVIEDLFTDRYEVDHILPQTLIKDDSIDNKALVLREENQMKRDNLVLPSEFRKHYLWWKHLKDINLISSKKYYNLIRDKYTDKDIEGFINRQLVETRQITKHVANIIKSLYKNTNIIYLKASISHNYRERFKLYKYRDLNDYHHAHDAYLAITLGIYQNKYLKTKMNRFEFKDLVSKLISENRYNELKYGYVVNSIDNDFVKINNETGEVLLNIDDFTKKIEDTLYRNDILVSKKVEYKTGEFYNQTKNKKGKVGVPLKKGLDTNLYGSYTSLNPSYAFVVKYQKKNKTEQRMIGIPIYIDIQNNQEITLNYIKDLLELDDVKTIEILTEKIPFYSVIDWEGQICSLVGATSKIEVCNALEFKIEKDKQIRWKNTLNRLFNNKKKAIEDLVYNNQLVEILNYVIKKIETEYKLYQNLIPELKEYINDSSLEILSIEDKEKTLKELFKLLKFNSQTANLKHFEASVAFGKKNGRIIPNATIIKKSTTGLKEQRYEF